MRYSLENLMAAYRTAKPQAYHDRNTSHGVAFGEYEVSLVENLELLRTKLNQANPNKYFRSREFIGTWTAVPKALEAPTRDEDGHLFDSDAFSWWDRKVDKAATNGRKNNGSPPEFRPIAKPSVDLMVVSALWCMTAGRTFDASLDATNVLGNRLRTSRADTRATRPTRALDLFRYWPRMYANWQRDGIQSMERSLRRDESIVAITMDLKSFYHNIDESFLLNTDFLNHAAPEKISLSPTERWLTRIIVNAIRSWRASLPTKKLREIGLPVGMTFSSVMANVALRQFDHAIKTNLMPIHYGRYVDDVFLVLRPGRRFENAAEFAAWLAERLGSNIASASETGIALNLKGLGRSELVFGDKKQKIFVLSGEEGLDLIRPIREELRRRSSEFRAMPHLPSEEAEMAGEALLAASDAKLGADSLRRAEEVSLRRHGFALQLRKAETYNELLEPATWAAKRRVFLSMARRHLLTPRGFMDFSGYWPRVMRLAAAAQDWELLNEYASTLDRIREALFNKNSSVSAKRAWSNQIERICEAVTTTLKGASTSPHAEKFVRRINGGSRDPFDVKRARESLEAADWMSTRRLEKWLERSEETAKLSGPRAGKSTLKDTRSTASIDMIFGWREICGVAERRGLSAPARRDLFFPTRRPRWPVLSRTIFAAGLSLGAFEDFVVAARWLRATDLRTSVHADEPGGRLSVRVGRKSPDASHGRARIVIASIKTAFSSWDSAVKGTPDVRMARYENFSTLTNSVVHAVERWRRVNRSDSLVPVYLAMPELSIPRRWADTICEKLAVARISLVGGLEYAFERDTSGNRSASDPKGNRSPVNAAALSLVLEPSLAGALYFEQRKRRPAWAEESEIQRILGVGLAQSGASLPLYTHLGFTFSVAICSDFTDVEQRAGLRGNVDAVFVPEWNPDTRTFSALVESAAMDVHSFVVQVNNRDYGDSRIRAPFREEHKRDIVQLKGGEEDFYAIAEINYKELRKEQTTSRPSQDPASTFKPFPIGFTISKDRETPKLGSPPRRKRGRRSRGK